MMQVTQHALFMVGWQVQSGYHNSVSSPPLRLPVQNQQALQQPQVPLKREEGSQAAD